MYQCQLRTTILAKICNSDLSAIQVHEQMDTCSEAAKTQADKHSKTLAPLYAGQPVAMYDTLQKDLGSCYCDTCPTMEQLSSMHQQCFHILLYARRHLCEHSVKAVDTVPSGTTATLQVLTRHHFLAGTTCTHPHLHSTCSSTSTAPATLATQMKQAPAVPVMPAVQKNALAPMSVTSLATPVQPQRSGHAHMAPRCLIQEI